MAVHNHPTVERGFSYYGSWLNKFQIFSLYNKCPTRSLPKFRAPQNTLESWHAPHVKRKRNRMRFHERHQIRTRTATPSLTLLQDHQGLPIATDLPLHQVITDPLHKSLTSLTSTVLKRDHLGEIRTGSNQRGERRQKPPAHEQTAHRCTAVAAAQLTCYPSSANIIVIPWRYITIPFREESTRNGFLAPSQIKTQKTPISTTKPSHCI